MTVFQSNTALQLLYEHPAGQCIRYSSDGQVATPVAMATSAPVGRMLLTMLLERDGDHNWALKAGRLEVRHTPDVCEYWHLNRSATVTTFLPRV